MASLLSVARAMDRHDSPPKVVGTTFNGKRAFKLTLVLRPQQYRRVRVGLGRMNTTGLSWDKRKLAAGEEPGYLRAMIGEFSDMVPGQAREVEFNVVYGDMNDLQPGDRVDVISAWTPGNSYWHVFGMYDGPAHSRDERNIITLP
jgi:hypothetical protein